MGAVETLEPPLVSSLVGSTMLLRGMGSLTVSRPIVVLAGAEPRYTKAGKAEPK
jgi:hypothetical protein